MRLISKATRACAVSVALVAASAGAGARQLSAQGETPVRESDEKPLVLRVNTADTAMNAATERARATVPQLIAKLNDPPPGLTYLGVKVRLGDADEPGEHTWLYDVTYADGTISGKLAIDAQIVPGFRANDVVRVAPGEISDWMTVENGRACGGFTDRILVAKVNAEERAAHFAAMGIPRLPPGDAVCDDGSTETRN